MFFNSQVLKEMTYPCYEIDNGRIIPSASKFITPDNLFIPFDVKRPALDEMSRSRTTAPVTRL